MVFKQLFGFSPVATSVTPEDKIRPWVLDSFGMDFMKSAGFSGAMKST